jgi:hypothetical protein
MRNRQVPVRFRVGPWSPLASIYLVIITCTLTYGAIWWLPQVTDYESQSNEASMPDAWWYHNVFGFGWMMYVSYTVVIGPAGFAAWATFSMWSWTMVMLRHGIAALVPIFPTNTLLSSLLQYTHLVSLTMATIVTFMWNIVIGPVIYVFFMKTPERKAKFLGYFTSFRLVQIHVFLMLYAILNSMSTPSPKFDLRDLWMTMSITYTYMLLYLLILDRIGVHLYPIFSPRTHWCAVIWSGVWCLHVVIYWMWKRILQD